MGSVIGGLVGLLVGDALGVPYEFAPPEHIPRRDAIEFAPPSDWPPTHKGVPAGTWSDDGAQALVLTESLLRNGCLDVDDFSAGLLRWRDAGFMAVDGAVFDWGIQTEKAFENLRAGCEPHRAGLAGERDNGNGSLMRVLPVALLSNDDDYTLAYEAMLSSTPTHRHHRSQLCCAMLCLWARRLIAGQAVEAAWIDAAKYLTSKFRGWDFYFSGRVDSEDAARELALLDLLSPPHGTGTGYVVDCLHSARLALTESSYEAVVKAAVSLGNDTYTTAAVAGGLAGIVFGIDGIPQRWRDGLRGNEILAPLLVGVQTWEARHG